ncbi:MAG: DUF5688 family protein [Lachnospiraceae bacterium]|nr:DUF5688 family protein [Lachnospiraceae bacterium]
MKFEEFVGTMSSLVQEQLSTCHVETTTVTKLNGIVRTGLVIREESDQPSPTIYLEEMYEQFKRKESSAEELATKILEIYRKGRLSKKFDLQMLMDYSKVREHLQMKLVNAEKNQELLEKSVHMELLNLAILFYLPTDAFGVPDGTITITNHQMEAWKVTKEELFYDAISFAETKNPTVLYPIEELVLSMMQGKSAMDGPESEPASIKVQLTKILEKYPQKEGEENPLVVVATNQLRRYGASCIINPQFMRDCAEKFGKNIYILPSSVHEVLLIPEYREMEAKVLLDMVLQVNSTEVEAGDFLADSVYYYDREKDRISIVANQVNMSCAG